LGAAVGEGGQNQQVCQVNLARLESRRATHQLSQATDFRNGGQKTRFRSSDRRFRPLPSQTIPSRKTVSIALSDSESIL
jgi:hypothetical protein